MKWPKEVTIQSIAPSNSSAVLTDLEMDQCSAILTDYLAFAHVQQRTLDDAKCLAASELLATWMSQAADLRDKIEGRD